MLRLEELFGIGRKRLAKLVDHEDKKRRKYDYRVVVKIMAALLAPEKRPKKRKRLTPGRPGRLPWLNASDLRSRVLSEIEARINSLSVQEHIKASFLQVVDRYRPDSGKK